LADITMPQMGETVTEGVVTRWLKAVGEAVDKDEMLFEISTDKVDTEIPSPVAGYLTEILVEEGTTVNVGTKLAVVSSEPLGKGAFPAIQAAAAAPTGARDTAKLDPPEIVLAVSSGLGVATQESSQVRSATDSGLNLRGNALSPVVRRLIAEHKIDVSDLQGSGLHGRITRDDVLAYVDSQNRTFASASAASRSAIPASRSATLVTPSPQVVTVTERASDEVIPFTDIRRRTAEHMVRSLATSAHTLVVTEVDFENVKMVCTRVKEAFEAEHGVSLTYLPFVARAVVEGIRAFPHVNSSVGEDSLIVHAGKHLGVAVDLGEEGLTVPVVHDIDAKRLPLIAREIAELTEKARSRTLSAAEISGGTFTITNPGSFGTFLTGPIINQPEAAILSLGGVLRRPVVVSLSDGSEAIAVHSVGMFALSFDHRAIDGAYASRFLKRVQEVMQTWDWNQEL